MPAVAGSRCPDDFAWVDVRSIKPVEQALLRPECLIGSEAPNSTKRDLGVSLRSFLLFVGQTPRGWDSRAKKN